MHTIIKLLILVFFLADLDPPSSDGLSKGRIRVVVKCGQKSNLIWSKKREKFNTEN